MAAKCYFMKKQINFKQEGVRNTTHLLQSATCLSF